MPLFILFLACIEQNLSSGDDVPSPLDDTSCPPAVVNGCKGGDSDSEPVDSYAAHTGTPTCEDKSFPSHAITEVAECTGSGVKPDWKLKKVWENTSLSTTLSTVAIGQLTDDNGNGKIDEHDDVDIVVTPYSSFVYAYDGATGKEMWKSTGVGAEQTTPAIGDLDVDGFPDVFVFSLYGSKAFSGKDGKEMWSGPGPGGIKPYCGGVSIADLDGNGKPEAIMGRKIINGQTGSTLCEGSNGYGTALSGESPQSVVADIDLDGDQEVIVGNAAMDINCKNLWTSSNSDGAPAVGNFDTDPEAEIAVASGSSMVYILDTNGTQKCSVNVGLGSYLGPPAIGDADGDGDADIAVPGTNGVALVDKNCKVTWKFTSAGTSGLWDGVSMYDLDGDGDWEVLDNGGQQFTILDGKTGAELASYKHSMGGGYNCGQAPAVADIDADGAVEIAYGVYSEGVHVVEDSKGFVDGFQWWNEHGYSITNVEDDGGIPAKPVSNVKTYNNFRAGPPIEAVQPAQNVVAEVNWVCTDECGDGRLKVWYSLGNNGSVDITDPVKVEIWVVGESGDQLIDTITWSSPLPAGEQASAVIPYTIEGWTEPVHDVYLKIDTGGELAECNETDNEARWGGVYGCD